MGLDRKKEELEQYVKEHHLEKKIYNLPDSAVMYMKFYSARIALFCRRSERDYPLQLMEAMAEGLPVVCSRIRGNVDLIEDGVEAVWQHRKKLGHMGKRLKKYLKIKEINRNN